MCVLKVTSCCCFDLEIGGLIFGYIELIMQIINACSADLSNLYSTLGSAFVPVLICICWIYGVHSRRTAFMVPNLVIWAIIYVICVSLLIIIPILAFTYDIHIHEQFPEGLDDAVAQYPIALFLVALAFWGIITAIVWFITAVKYSLYKIIRSANHGSSADLFNESFDASV